MRGVALLIALMVALAGCSDSKPAPSGSNEPGGPDDPSNPATPSEPSAPAVPITQIKLLSNYDLTGCTGVSFGTSADAAAVNALLPDGYRTLQSSPELGVAEQAVVVADVFQCSSFTAAGAVFEDVWFGRAFVPIEQPAAYANISADGHHYILEMIAAEDILAALWPAAGYPTHNGTASDDSQPPSASWTAGEYGWASAATAAPTAASDLSFAWYHEMDVGNVVVWTGNESFPAGSAGAGRLAVPGDSPLASLQIASSGLAGTITAVSDVEYTGNYLVVDLAEPR